MRHGHESWATGRGLT